MAAAMTEGRQLRKAISQMLSCTAPNDDPCTRPKPIPDKSFSTSKHEVLRLYPQGFVG